MRDYSRFSPKFWVGTTGKELRKRGLGHQVLAAYLITSPSANMIGLYYLPIAYMAHETGIPVNTCADILKELCELGFCSYDYEAEVVWVLEAVRYQLGETKPGDKQRIGAVKQYEAAPECSHLMPFHDRHKGFLPFKSRRGSPSTASMASKEALPGAKKALGKPLASPPDTSDGEATATSKATSDEQSEATTTREANRGPTTICASAAEDAAVVTAGEVVAMMQGWDGWPKHTGRSRRGEELAVVLARDRPFTRGEILRARALTESVPGQPSFGLLMRKVEQLRNDQRAPPRALTKQDQSMQQAFATVEAFNATRRPA